MDDLLSTVANQVSGGQFDLSKRFVSNMPFPDIFDASFDRYVKNLSPFGKSIFEGSNVKRNDLNSLVKSMFKM